MTNKPTPLFPKISFTSNTATQLLAGQSVEEASLVQLEKHILAWILGHGNTRDPIQVTPQEDGKGSVKHLMIEVPEVTLVPGPKFETIRVTAQRTLRVHRLLLFSAQSLASIKILRFMIGMEEPIQVEKGMSAELFRVMSRHPPFHENCILNPGMSCTLWLENHGTKPVTLSGALLGSTLQF